MRLSKITPTLYQREMHSGALRKGALMEIETTEGKKTIGEIAPLPGWSCETLDEALKALEKNQEQMLQREWTKETLSQDLEAFSLPPSTLFGVEMALLALLDPKPSFLCEVSALLTGNYKEILKEAQKRKIEGFKSAKLKIGHLDRNEAKELIYALKKDFFLRIDANGSFETEAGLRFFEEFAHKDFDYVEEPFKNPLDLVHFPLPFAVDESYRRGCVPEGLKNLKALIYKPTLQGGFFRALPLQAWTQKMKVSLVLSSSFEGQVGLCAIAQMAQRLGVTAPLGLGTYAYFKEGCDVFENSFHFQARSAFRRQHGAYFCAQTL